MKKKVCLLASAALAATLCFGNSASAAPAFSFETIATSPPNAPGPDGFFGIGAQVTQSDIGVTDGSFSMKYLAGAGGFVGARTETMIPPALNNPPGLKSVSFDMTIVDAYTDTFADIGLTFFGHALNAPGGAEFGHQVQFAGTASIAALGVGTHAVTIDLGLSQGPYRAGETFNEIFGPDPNDLTVASAFQFYISKNAGTPATVYIDNVRLNVPEPATALLVGLCAVAGALVRRR